MMNHEAEFTLFFYYSIIIVLLMNWLRYSVLITVRFELSLKLCYIRH